MAGNIWVLAEHWRGKVSDITYELLALGREIARNLGVDLQAVLLGHEVRTLAQTLGAASSVLYVDREALAAPVPESFAQALASAMRTKNPQAVLIPLTNVSWEIGSFAAAELDAVYINACKDVRLVDGKLQVRSVLYGGKMEAIVTPAESLVILGILPGARPADQGRSETAPMAEELTVDLPATAAVRLKRYLEPEVGDIDISKQDVLVSVGRGIQNRDNVALAEELARELDGAVCGSRPVIDQGWLPLTRQVGKSGAVVKPKLYVAAGISGAPEHVEGMKNSELIIAVNSDPQAPIFNVAHYGINADVIDVLPAFTEAVRRRKKEVRTHAA
ncbi:MAG TPA: electron transfer flavoprotein subunit alpha/FixB family protein [Candidatus Sulfotelmatobacter sp.]|nr:electron transfer flavoprotein subunit alpha/FixB family protein [Candidatus Sulfotelmatobacter sp.]